MLHKVSEIADNIITSFTARVTDVDADTYLTLRLSQLADEYTEYAPEPFVGGNIIIDYARAVNDQIEIFTRLASTDPTLSTTTTGGHTTDRNVNENTNDTNNQDTLTSVYPQGYTGIDTQKYRSQESVQNSDGTNTREEIEKETQENNQSVTQVDKEKELRLRSELRNSTYSLIEEMLSCFVFPRIRGCF